MKVSETKFEPIIETTQQYIVPLFQRPYRWANKEWQTLWDDIVWLCETPELRSYFIGSIVTLPLESTPEGISKFLLVDGQQRLTTIFVLLKVISDAAQVEETELAQEIEEKLLFNRYKKGNDYYKLVPTQVDRAAFQSVLQGTLGTEHSLRACYRFFEQRVKQSSLPLAAIKSALTNRLSVVSITLDRDDNPHLVFESLNFKGQPLTQADLIRNYFFMRLPADKQDDLHKTYWLPLEQGLGNELTEGLRHYLMRDGVSIKQNSVYFVLKERAERRAALETLQEVSIFGAYYSKFLTPASESNPKIREALGQLARLDMTTVYPFLLNCYHDYATNNGLLADDLVGIIHVLENFIMRRFVCNVPTHGLNKFFLTLHRRVLETIEFSSLSFVEGLQFILQSQNYPKDVEFRTHLCESKLYGNGDRLKKTRLILERLENAHVHKEPATFESATIEHIMPQKLTPWWQKHLGAEWEADHESLCHGLGNLTLTGYNLEMSNEPFPKKHHRLLTSHFELNRYFHKVKVWNRKAIEDRAEHLAEAVLRIWPYLGDKLARPTSKAETVTGSTPLAVYLLGERRSVVAWRDVLVVTLEMLIEIAPEKFTTIANAFPRRIGSNKGTFRRPGALSNGYFVETNLSAINISQFCKQLVVFSGLSDEDWRIDHMPISLGT